MLAARKIFIRPKKEVHMLGMQPGGDIGGGGLFHLRGIADKRHDVAAQYERVFIHSGGGTEAELAREMERAYPNVTALYGKVRLAGEMDLISHLDCVVSMDSLVMHLASLVATPVVSVWGATHPGLGFLGYGSSMDHVLQADMECRPCSVFGNRPCRYGDYRCMAAVSPAQIVAAVEKVLAGCG